MLLLAAGCYDFPSLSAEHARDGGSDLRFVFGHCSDAIQDGDETDLDCGGVCAPCAEGRRCLRPADCASALCANNRCAVRFACAEALACVEGCPVRDAACADGCAARITTVQGRSRLMAVLACLAAACPGAPGGACDPKGSPAACAACRTKAGGAGGACASQAMACGYDA